MITPLLKICLKKNQKTRKDGYFKLSFCFSGVHINTRTYGRLDYHFKADLVLVHKSSESLVWFVS